MILREHVDSIAFGLPPKRETCRIDVDAEQNQRRLKRKRIKLADGHADLRTVHLGCYNAYACGKMPRARRNDRTSNVGSIVTVIIRLHPPPMAAFELLLCLSLTLRARLVDTNRSFDLLLAAAAGCPAHCGILAVEPNSNPDITIVGADGGGRIEPDPAETRNVSLGPFVRARLPVSSPTR